MMFAVWIMLMLSRISSYRSRIWRSNEVGYLGRLMSYSSVKGDDKEAPFHADIPITVKTAYEQAQSWLERRHIEDSEESARYLLCHLNEVGSYRYSDFTTSQQKSLSAASITSLNQMLQERALSKPIQYILGNWDFYGNMFLCKPPVLIPRPETEELVDLVLKDVKSFKDPLRILDIGSGSGVIGISLALNLKGSVVDCIDLSDKAVALTEENADRLLPTGRRSDFHCYHMDYKTFLQTKTDLHHQFDIIVSNPPYIPSQEMSTLQKEVRLYEDHRALDGGEDGLSIARDIMTTCHTLLKPSGLRSLWFELSREHPLILEKEYERNTAMKVKAFNDFTKQPRFVKIVYN